MFYVLLTTTTLFTQQSLSCSGVSLNRGFLCSLYRTQASVLGLSMTFLFVFFHCVCHWNISGMAEQICARFTGNACLVPSLNVRVKGQRSRSSGTKPGKLPSHPHRQCIVTRAPYAANHVQQETGPLRRSRGWRECTLAAACVRCMFGKVSK